MQLPSWARQLNGRERAGVVLVVVLLVTGAFLQGRMDSDGPSAAESSRLGWYEASIGDDLARDIFERVNDERAERGSPPLVWDEGLAERARQWSEHMIASGEFEHSPDEHRAHPRFVGTGENIAIDHPTTAEAHVALMRSDGHRRNILEPDYDALGVGVVCRRDGVMWVTQIFGVEQPSPPRAPVEMAPDPIERSDRGHRCP